MDLIEDIGDKVAEFFRMCDMTKRTLGKHHRKETSWNVLWWYETLMIWVLSHGYETCTDDLAESESSQIEVFKVN